MQIGRNCPRWPTKGPGIRTIDLGGRAIIREAMTKRTSPNVADIDLAPGLWIWRLEHPSWNEHCDWQEVVTCVRVDAGGERWLLDPLLLPDDATQVRDRLAKRPPTAVPVLIPDHSRPTWSDPRNSVDVLTPASSARAMVRTCWLWSPRRSCPTKSCPVA